MPTRRCTPRRGGRGVAADAPSSAASRGRGSRGSPGGSGDGRPSAAPRTRRADREHRVRTADEEDREALSRPSSRRKRADRREAPDEACGDFDRLAQPCRVGRRDGIVSSRRPRDAVEVCPPGIGSGGRSIGHRCCRSPERPLRPRAGRLHYASDREHDRETGPVGRLLLRSCRRARPSGGPRLLPDGRPPGSLAP